MHGRLERRVRVTTFVFSITPGNGGKPDFTTAQRPFATSHAASSQCGGRECAGCPHYVSEKANPLTSGRGPIGPIGAVSRVKAGRRIATKLRNRYETDRDRSRLFDCLRTSGRAGAGQRRQFLTGGAKVDGVERGGEVHDLPKPDIVLVRDFAAPASDVTMDTSLAARLRRRRMHLFGTSDDLTPDMLVQNVQTAFTQGLSDELKKVQIPTGKVGEPVGDSARSSLVVAGEFIAIDEGNESKRIMVGIGRGATAVRMHVTVSSVSSGRSAVVLAFDVSSASGKSPGALLTMGSGSLAVGAAKKAAGNTRSTAEHDASRMGKLVALQIEGLMVGQQRIASQ